MEHLDRLRQAAEAKRKENAVLYRAYAATLDALFPANFIFVVGAALLSLVAGAELLIEREFIDETVAGGLALISAALTVVHSKLGCDSYQAECRKLISYHRALAVDYGDLRDVEDVEEFKKRLSVLNEQLSSGLKNTTALPFNWAVRSATKAVERSPASFV